MSSRARIGRPLPGAGRAHASAEKWSRWILAPDGHGDEWSRVFRVGPADRHAIWAEIVRGVRRAPVITLRDRGRHGVVCGVVVKLTLNARTAFVMTSWHYREDGAVPRLVTAYPIVNR
ncbi:MAG: hypothetical protein JSS99_06000 [Actinobacteria bacterium]|nr:hypothetical protein [Actinomycetota bacterium]